MKQKEARVQRYTGIKKIDVRTFTMFAVLVMLWLFFTYFTSNGFSSLETSFLSTRNLSNLMRQMTTVGVMGISMVLVIVSGGIDLSAGAVVGFIGSVNCGVRLEPMNFALGHQTFCADTDFSSICTDIAEYIWTKFEK